MADQDYPQLYQQMKDSAQAMSDASVANKQMMSADDVTDVTIPGYGAKASYSKQIRLKVESLTRIYTDNAQAQAAITAGGIPNGWVMYVQTSLDDSLYGMYFNNNGTLAPILDSNGNVKVQPAGAVVQAALQAPNVINNSVADPAYPQPKLLPITGVNLKYTTASAAMKLENVVESIICPPRPNSSDPSVNYLFTKTVDWIRPGSYVAVSFLIAGQTNLAFTRFIDSTGADIPFTSHLTVRPSGVSELYASIKLGANQKITSIFFGCQQRGTSTTTCEIALPKMAVSERKFVGIGGDVTLAEAQLIDGIVAPNLIYNGFADPAFQLPTLRGGSTPWVSVDSITDATIKALIADYGAYQCLVADPVSSGYVDSLVEIRLDATAFRRQWMSAQFYVYVQPGSGLDPKDEVTRASVFFIDEDNAVTNVVADTVQRVTANLFKVRATYQFTDKKPRRASMGIRNSSTVTRYYVFGFFMAASGQKIREISETPARDPLAGARIDGNAPNRIYNQSADPTLLQPTTYQSIAWTPIASLPTDVQSITQFGAKAALANTRLTTGFKDTLVQIVLTNDVFAGQYVRCEWYVYMKMDAGVSPDDAIKSALAFFWVGSTFTQQVASVINKISTNVYVVQSTFRFLADATRVIFGVRNARRDTDFYVFNPSMATSDLPILRVTQGLVRDPDFNRQVDSRLIGVDWPTVAPIYPARIPVDSPVVGGQNFMLMPDVVILPPDKPLLLQCPQMMMNLTQDMNQFLDFSFRGYDPSGWPYSYETNRTFELDIAKLGSSVSIGYHDRQKSNQWTRRDVTLVKGPTSGTGTKNIALIGDSLTNRGQSARVTALLQARGFTINQLGVLNQQEGGVSEGRESWSAANFVGQRNQLGGVPIVISGDKPGNYNKNPFLFAATPAQLAANPDLCFQNTGSAPELSYADTQTGTFYTFDYRKYLDQQGFPDPHAVSIALAWNDGSQGLTPDIYIKFIKYMVSQIKLAAPACKIGVAPYFHSYYQRARVNTTTSNYVRETLGAYRSRSGSGIYVLPTWAVMPADTEWTSETAGTIDTKSGSFLDTRGDGIHWDPHGRQYSAAQCLFPFYMYALSL
ncbi:hypothetical protein MA12_gp05 [Pectobacterium phage MA12]|uniref:Uncharacterized protein n=1 Tax=Pectobacterium phage MA12 TaxID=2686474 RepID=A0A6B9RHY5_9CAUD|nr:hypothetical protein JT356_gp29 [Pectobacterium phage MA11]YP_010000227.1 hypothetical protein JT357_gp05 [Pectobacterium phage MA12]QGF21053.1 hypothetical protein MA11_gp29 [Pectobacterium phage MA11]QHI00832.1 hypothetical protein MA12_gp05 [Pectobacterium phage MA12]